MKNELDCRRKEHKGGLRCEARKLHNRVCKGKDSEVAGVMKNVVSLASPQLAFGADIGKFVYKKSFC